MRALKILGLAIGGLVALVVLLLAGVWLLVNPNDYKDRIAAGVKSSTGRDLALTGDIKLSVFPWVGLTLGPATLGNPPGFGNEPFATVRHASLRVKLIPLLSKQLQIGRIVVDGLDLRLQRNADGKGNWEFGADKVAADASSGRASQPLDLAGVAINDSRIAFGELVAADVNVDVGHVAPGVAIPVKARLSLKTAPAAQPMPLSTTFDLTMNVDQDRYALAQFVLEGSLTPAGAKSAMPWKFASPAVSLDLTAQTLASTSFDAEFAAARLAGHVAGSKLIDAPALSGDFALQPVALKVLLAQLGIAPPVTRDARALTSLAASGRFAYAGGDARGEELKVSLDDSMLEGDFAMNLESSAMTFDLALDHIDADRYLPPPTVAAAAARSEPFELPVDALKPLQAKGQLRIGQAKVVDVRLSNLTVGIDANDGVTRIAPAQAQLYGGRYSGEVSIDTRPAQPKLSIDQTMSGIDIAQLMNDFLKTRRLSGKGNVATKLTAHGRNSDALIKSLDGKVSMNLADGAVEGIDLWYAISQAQSLIQKRELAGGTSTGKTSFQTFKASADLASGVATTNDLAIASQLLRVTGKGTSNLATQAIDYQVTATVLKAPPGAAGEASGLVLAAIPVNITGTFDNPKVRPDLEGVAKARLKQEVEKQKDKIEEKVRNKVQDQLKNLFKR